MHRRQGVYFLACGLRFPGRETLRGGWLGGAGLSGDSAPGFDVMQEHAGDKARPVAPLPRPGRMVPGAGVGGVAFQPGDGTAGRVQQGGLDLIGPGIERGGLGLLAVLPRLAGSQPVGGVQHRRALDRVDGHVEVGNLVRVRAAPGRTGLGQLGCSGVRMRGQVRRHGGLFAFAGRRGLAGRDKEFSARADVVLVHGRSRQGPPGRSGRARRHLSRPTGLAVRRPGCSRTSPRRSLRRAGPRSGRPRRGLDAAS
jgi:hypothetical protein